MKKISIVACLLLASTSLLAENNGYYVGASIGKVKADVTISAGGLSANADTDASATTITFGKYLTKNDTLSIFKTFVDDESNVSVDVMGISYKHLFDLNDKAQLFLGASYSVLDYEETGLKAIDNLYSKDKVSWKTDIISLDIGFQINELAKNLNAEIGYKIDISTSGSGSVSYNGVPLSLEFDNVKVWYAGLNYKF